MRDQHPKPPLQITSVRWGLTTPLGNFSSARLDAEALVDTESTAESTLQALQEWVAAQSPLSNREYADIYSNKDRLLAEERDIEIRIEQQRARWERVKAWCEKIGIPVQRELLDDLPF